MANIQTVDVTFLGYGIISRMATRVAASGGPGASGGAGPGGPGSGAAARALEGFHSLRAEQRALANKLSELEQELNEHK